MAPRRSSPSTTPRATAPASCSGARPTTAGTASSGEGPDRLRRSRRRQQAQAGHGHHPAGHLRPDLQLRHPPASGRLGPGSPADPQRGLLGPGQRSAYYNRYRNKAAGGFRWWLPSSSPNSSERLRDFRHQYEYSVVIGFNYDQPVRHRGSGIFLHVNGDGATAGCVSARRWFLKAVLNRLEPSAEPVIAIGR